MVRLRPLILAVGLLLTTVPVARADSGTPQPAIVPTAPPAVVATVAPPQEAGPTPTPAPIAPPPTVSTYPGPVHVTGENHPLQQITQVPVTESSQPPTAPPASESAQAPTATPAVPTRAVTPVPNVPGASTSPGITGPPADQTGTNGSTTVNLSTAPVAAAAPSQLQCQGRRWPVSAPFLSSPFSGWTDINSFVDHDSPDYSVDGKIVLANGVTALASAGAESDFFPAYWSPDLRQYVNYDGHNGYDFGISYQPVYAAAAGTVRFAGWNSADPGFGYGQMVLIDHHNGYVTLYGHLSQLQVQDGDKVSAGEEIGISGTTGNSTGPHLHFSVFHNCQVTDPYGWTGTGSDPLKAFDGETSAYLWLPGHDPLVVNPPPNWPTFPAGLRLTVADTPGLGFGARVLPPADRLLLLQLPAPSPQALAPGVAVARTTSRLLREWESLQPYLADLKASGALDWYQYLPAAGAVWIRGTTQAGQLEALPGVASLGGVQPKDVRAAETGLAHAVLVQTQAQQAPSLWPVGFHSAFSAFRPLVGVTSGQPLVTGFALPGQDVHLVLLQHDRPAARGVAVADSETGGFVSLLSNASGPVSPRAGDLLEMASGGRHVTTTIHALLVRARASEVVGVAPPGSSVQVSAIDPSGQVLWRLLAATRLDGNFRLRPRQRVAVGSLLVASVVDMGGDQESVASFRPGMQAQAGSEVVRGWTVGRHPRLEIERHGRPIFVTSIHRASDGSFLTELHVAGRPLVLAAGDVASLGSSRHQETVTVAGSSSRRTGAYGSSLHISIREASPELRLRTTLATPVRLEIYNPHGSIAAASVIATPAGGSTHAIVRDWLGRPIDLRPGMRLYAISGNQTMLITVPPLSLSVSRTSRSVAVATTLSASNALYLTGSHVHRILRLARGTTTVALPLGVSFDRLRSISVQESSGAVTVERSIDLQATSRAHKHHSTRHR